MTAAHAYNKVLHDVIVYSNWKGRPEGSLRAMNEAEILPLQRARLQRTCVPAGCCGIEAKQADTVGSLSKSLP
jgi:hypothetical protein